jgi:effector-binding domain-containing protein
LSCEIVELSEQKSLSIKKIVNTMQLGSEMEKAYTGIAKFMEENGQGFMEQHPPYCLYRNVNWDELMKPMGFWAKLKMMFKKWNLEMGVPVQEGLPQNCEFELSVFPAGKFLKTVHLGAYYKVSETYKKMVTWAQENGIKLGNISIEQYTNSPKEVATDELKTFVLIPVE